jgi:crotonobetainyl-CoA:carnitine CoA-transferase CaiB-like acyl-CoA transferase
MKIVDLSTDVAGRFAAKLFAMTGIPVHRPYVSRKAMPGHTDDPLTLYLDTGKTAVLLDDAAVQGAVLADLLAGAHLVFTSFDKRQHLGLAAAVSVPSACIQITTSSFGTTGPYAAYRGGPLADWAAGGYLAITGEPDREPLIGPENLCAYICGYTAALGAEAALRMQNATGQGQHVDVSTMEAMLCLHQSTFSRLGSGHIRERTGRFAEIYPLTVLPCRSGHVSLGVVTEGEFDRLAIAFGLPELAFDERFNSGAARWAHREALDRELARYLLQHEPGEVVEVLQANGVAAAEASDAFALLANPQLNFRGFWARPSSPGGTTMPGNPLPRTSIQPAPGGKNRTPAADVAIPNRHRVTTGLPLDGITIFDFTAYWAGPSATRCLADLGANVIWVERPRSRVDHIEPLDDPLVRTWYLSHTKMNRHKRSIVLDLETQAGRDTARLLAGKADAIVENFRPGVADRLGIGATEMCAAFPDMVYVSLSGFGSAGPWGDWRSFGPNIEAASSILTRTGYPGGPPMRLGHALPDGVGGVAGALAVLRGLRIRDHTGQGGWFDISQLEVYTALSGEDIVTASRSGHAAPRIGNRSRSGAIQGVFPCLGNDQWITIRLTDQPDVELFAAVTGLAALIPLSLAQPRDDAAIDALIGGYTSRQEKFELTGALQQAGLEVLPVFKPDELIADPHLAERGFFARVDCNGTICFLPGSPLHSIPPLADPNGVAPLFGEHTAEITDMLKKIVTADAM